MVYVISLISSVIVLILDKYNTLDLFHALNHFIDCNLTTEHGGVQISGIWTSEGMTADFHLESNALYLIVIEKEVSFDAHSAKFSA